MKRSLRDDAQVQALAERLGAWPAIRDSIRRGHSGALIAGDWVFGYFQDGLLAFETSSPIEAIALAGGIMQHLGGPVSASVARPAVPGTH
jgi:hypothetical protein